MFYVDSFEQSDLFTSQNDDHDMRHFIERKIWDLWIKKGFNHLDRVTTHAPFLLTDPPILTFFLLLTFFQNRHGAFDASHAMLPSPGQGSNNSHNSSFVNSSFNSSFDHHRLSQQQQQHDLDSEERHSVGNILIPLPNISTPLCLIDRSITEIIFSPGSRPKY